MVELADVVVLGQVAARTWRRGERVRQPLGRHRLRHRHVTSLARGGLLGQLERGGEREDRFAELDGGDPPGDVAASVP
ncbi:hypothetical protein [Streptomyces sp. NPDC017964]|uniref:hypothetical protein n=1 Tax=Streptomyces sp. NPDC017964 TaxID=3365022 RepID=UPI0037A2FBCC